VAARRCSGFSEPRIGSTAWDGSTSRCYTNVQVGQVPAGPVQLGRSDRAVHGKDRSRDNSISLGSPRDRPAPESAEPSLPSSL
jgi:hypothetical protein